ncbi:MAG TPA: hypothetical protein VFK05_28830 [Polyangiaceae bacterium]|nr:hypothetical protein [Polyangiaceae bacterium]
MKPLEALRALGTGAEAPADAKQRVHTALMASLAATATAAAAAASAASAASRADSLPPAGGARNALPTGLSSAKVLAIAGGIWLIGGATGAALFGALQTQQVRVVYVDHPVLSSNVAAPPATSPVTPAPAPEASGASNSAAASGARRALPAIPSQGSELARERAVLDLARADAARGEPARVLEQTEQHRAQFPHPKLAEEREALAIRALLSLGRADEAHRRAEAFHRAYPHSLLAPAIDAALSAP